VLKFSPDGQKLAGTPADLTITMWDAGSGRELYRLGTRPASFNNATTTSDASFAFSPDGKRLAWRGTIWDAETGKRLATPKDAKLPNRRGGISAFSPDGKRILDRNGVWDAATGERLAAIDKMERPTFSPDGKRVADGRKIWDAQTGLELLSLGQEGDIGQVAFSLDGHRLAVVNSWSYEVIIYDATPLPEKP
jgi:WD40 repeat protein